MRSFHLNQSTVYSRVIHPESGLAAPIEGDLGQPGSPLFLFRQSLSAFWKRYEANGPLAGKKPSNGEYGQALYQALIAAQLPLSHASFAYEQAKQERLYYGLTESDEVPNLPEPSEPYDFVEMQGSGPADPSPNPGDSSHQDSGPSGGIIVSSW
jgi:hypothetical protein